MIRVYICILLGYTVTVPDTQAQLFPKTTAEARKQTNHLIHDFVQSNAVEIIKDAKGKALQYKMDVEKTREFVKKHLDRFTKPVIDALIAGRRDPSSKTTPLLNRLLFAYGENEKDTRAWAHAHAFGGIRGQQLRRTSVAIKHFQRAYELFSELNMTAWQIVCTRKLGFLARTQERYSQALNYYEEALQLLWKTHQQKSHPAIANVLNQIGMVYQNQDRLKQSVQYYQNALKMLETLFPKRPHPEKSEVLNNLGVVYSVQNEYQQAHFFLLKALKIHLQIYREKPHPQLAQILNNLGAVSQEQNEAQQAKKYYQQALTIRQKLYSNQPHPDLARSLNNVGSIYQKQRNYQKAKKYYRQALNIYEKVFPDQAHAQFAQLLDNFGVVHHQQGNYQQAKKLLQKALRMRQKLHPTKPSPELAHSLNNLGVLYHNLGDEQQAMKYHQRALKMRRKLYDEIHSDVAQSLNNLAGIYQARKNYSQAEKLFQQALKIREKLYAEELHADLAISLNNVGGIHHRQGDYDQAKKYYHQALEVRKKLYPDESHPTLARSLSNLGGLHHSQREYQQAKKYYRHAIDLFEEIYNDTLHPQMAQTLYNLSICLHDEKDFREALKVCNKALRQLLLTKSSEEVELETLQVTQLQILPETANVLHFRGRLQQYLANQDKDPKLLRKAARSMGLAMKVVNRLRHDVFQTEESKLEAGATREYLTFQRLLVYRKLFSLEQNPTDLTAAFTAIEEGRAQLLLQAITKSRASLLGKVPEQLRSKEQQLLTQLRKIDLQIQDALQQERRKVFGTLQLLYQQRSVLEEKLQELIVNIESQHPQYAALRYPKPCNLEQALDSLHDNEVALMFVLGVKDSLVFLLEKSDGQTVKPEENITIAHLPFGREPLEEHLAVLLDTGTLQLTPRAKFLARNLYAKLLAPVSEKIKGKDLLIVADGALWDLPFELLVEEGKYLIENHHIRYAPSLTALYWLRQWARNRPRLPDEPLWAMGDPIFSATDPRLTGNEAALKVEMSSAVREILRREKGKIRGASFDRLEATQVEVKALAQMLNPPVQNVVLGKQATERTIKKSSQEGKLARCRFLHFATHGVLGLAQGLPPGLVLSQLDIEPDDKGIGRNDGYLRLDEVTHLELNADLVVLSACHTGQGELYAGEGVVGLSRAFLYAGTRGVIASLWSVADRETALLMVEAYTRLSKGRSTPEAFREAKLKMIQEGKAPFFWAPFILLGE